MRRIIKPFITAIFVMLLAGCANTKLISDVDPQVDISKMKSFHVVKFEKDNRGIEKLIANKLNSMGLDASSGTNKTPSHPVDVIVEYQDKWMWDLTMYMLELNINFRDPETNYQFATGRSFRTSLARKSPEEMVDEVLNDIFRANKVVSQ
ncbi:hypothetical protein EH243_09815 [Amphritea opalescens]|uniref:DUF4136 domain-containing protein n=1 Tax=Amphritea opalescens TaxID=2490544 RepID=A0A430KR30_9GAMM|nr:hypothetical protein [Amphritea opalescens]RTE65969.1 hypothetical protein EH243_09815 [Amphritea opalescens]